MAGAAVGGAGIGEAIGGVLNKFLERMLLDPMMKALEGVISVAFMWAFHGINRMFPEQALWLAKKITQTYYSPPAEWAGFISQYLEQMTGSRISLDDITGHNLMSDQREFMQAVGKKFLDPMLGLIMPTPEQSKLEPMAGAERFMSANLQFQMSAWLLHLLGDIQSFGMFKSLKDLPNAISWSYGIGWLSWMVMGPVFRAGITAPMEKHFAKYYRQLNLTNAQFVDAYYAGLKSSQDTYTALAESGLSDEDITILIKLSQKRFSESQMEYMVKRGYKDKTELIQYYKDQSMPLAEAEMMAERLLTKTKRDLIEKIVAKAEKLYRAGLTTEAELRQYYEQISYDRDEQDLAIIGLELDNIETGTLTDAQIGRLYQLGKMSYEDAFDRLKTRYADDRDAELFLELYPPQEKRVEAIKPRQLTPSEIGRLYQLGKLDYDDALSMLTTRTPPVLNADLLLLLYEREEPEEIEELLKGLTPAQVGRLYQKGIITEEQAIQRLLAFKYPEDEALYFLSLYVPVAPKPLPSPPRLTASQIARLYQLKEITLAAATERLMTYFKDATEVSLFLKLYPIKVT